MITPSKTGLLNISDKLFVFFEASALQEMLLRIFLALVQDLILGLQL